MIVFLFLKYVWCKISKKKRNDKSFFKIFTTLESNVTSAQKKGHVVFKKKQPVFEKI